MPKKTDKIEKKINRFKGNLQKLMVFEDYELEILDGACENLRLYYTACAAIRNEGLTIKTQNGYLKKHPAIEASKTTWASFLSGLRQLKISETQSQINRTPGKPGRKN